MAEAYRLRYERTEGATEITGHGTALCFKKGMLLTAAHNVSSGEPFVEVGKDWFKAKVVRKDEDLDVALLECKEAEKWSPLALDTPSPGKGIVLRGSKRGAEIKDFPGRVVRAWYKGRAQWLAEVEFDHGDSGGALMFAKEVVAGMAVAGIPKDGDMDKGKALFLPATVLWAFLLEHP
jgi:hypothetical protein